ncbi:MAG: T9SS type A sorting domain-containing protein [Bacteroidia bacterium]
MKKQLLTIATFSCLAAISFSQPTNIYQPNGATTNFGKVAADSLNYYVVNYPALTLMKIDPSNNATLLTTLTADPIQTMIWNNGKGIFPVASGSPFKLFDGTNQIDITGGQLPMAGYTLGNVILLDYFHKGNSTYFRTNDKIYKTDYSSPSSIVTLATRQSNTGVGITDMSHTTHSIIYQNIVLTTTGVLKRIDLSTGNITTLDSASNTSNYDKGIVYNNEYYYCTPFGSTALGVSKIYKVSNSGIKTVFYTEMDSTKYILKVIGGTPNGIIAVTKDNSGANEYVSINAGVATATSLNFGTFANSFPANNYAGGVTTNSLVYFSAYDTSRTLAVNKALWVTDGTLVGTKKIKSGPASVFNMSGLDQTLLGEAASCGNDLYYKGRNGSVNGLIYVNGTTFAMQSYTDLPNPVTIRQTASGILAILRTSNASATKAVYKVDCSSLNAIGNNVATQNNINVFPNPANEVLNIELLDFSEGATTIKISNTLGQVVFLHNLLSSKTTINTNDFSKGMYFVSVENNHAKFTRKIIIE